MHLHEMWEGMLHAIGNDERQIQTTPMTGKQGVWFTVEAAGGKVCVSEGKREPKSAKARTLISKEEFARMYPLWIRREAGEPVSKEAQAASWNQVYIYAIFSNFCKQE